MRESAHDFIEEAQAAGNPPSSEQIKWLLKGKAWQSKQHQFYQSRIFCEIVCGAVGA